MHITLLYSRSRSLSVHVSMTKIQCGLTILSWLWFFFSPFDCNGGIFSSFDLIFQSIFNVCKTTLAKLLNNTFCIFFKQMRTNLSFLFFHHNPLRRKQNSFLIYYPRKKNFLNLPHQSINMEKKIYVNVAATDVVVAFGVSNSEKLISHQQKKTLLPKLKFYVHCIMIMASDENIPEMRQRKKYIENFP